MLETWRRRRADHDPGGTAGGAGVPDSEPPDPEEAQTDTVNHKEGPVSGSVPGSGPEYLGRGLSCFCALAAGLLFLALAVPAESLRSVGIYPVAALFLGILFGAAAPDSFERSGALLAGLFGRRGRALGSLVEEAGYRCNRYTHSLGGLFVTGLVLVPAPIFFGPLVGGSFGAGALAGYAIHLVLEATLTTAVARVLWPLPWALPWSLTGLRKGSLLRAGTGLQAGAILVGAAAGLWTAYAAGIRPQNLYAVSVEAITAAPGEVISFFVGYPLGLAGIVFYGGGLWLVSAAVLPRIYKRVAVAARDDSATRYTGGIESYALKPYSDASFDPRRFARVLSELPLGDEGRVSFGYLVADQARMVVSGRGIWEAAAAVDAAYGDLTLIPLSPEEAWVLPPGSYPGSTHDGYAGSTAEAAKATDEATGQQAEELVPVVVRYEVDGAMAELGLRGLEDFDLRDTDPLSGPLTNLQNAVSPKDGERVMLLADVREAATEDGEPVFLTQALSRRKQQEEAAKDEQKQREDEIWRRREDEKTRRYQKSRQQPGSRKGSAGNPGWEAEVNAAMEAAVEGLFRVLFYAALLGPRLGWRLLRGLFGAISGAGKNAARPVEAGSKEREAAERRAITARASGRSFRVTFQGVAYVKAGASVEARVKRVEAAYERYFAAFGRRGGAQLVRVGGRKSSAKGYAKGYARTEAGAAELRLNPADPSFGGQALDGPVITNEELAALFHPLGKEVGVHGREVGSVLAIPPPPAMTPDRTSAGGSRRSIRVAHSNHATYLATPVELTFDELRTHGGITGGTGYGKSSLQYRIIESAWESGLGIALLDPKMDFFACVISNLSQRRLKQAIVVDAGHEAPVPAYNLLVCPEKVDTAQRAATLLEGLKKRFPANAFQGRNSNYFMMSFRALIGANMARIRAGEKSRYVLPDLATGKFLATTDDATGERPHFRAEVLEHLEGIAEFEDVLDFFEEFDKLKAATQQEHVQSVTNKIGPLAGAQVRRFLGAPGQDFDMRTAIEEGLGIFLNLSKHVFPGGASALVGTLFFSDIIAAAKARHWEATMRGTQDAMRDFLIAADEVQNFTCPEMVEILAEARAYRTPIWFGHQYAAQIKDEDLREAMAQAATHAYFNQTPKDAGYIAPILGDPFTKERLANTPKYNFVIKAGEKIATCQTIPLPHTDPVRANEVRLASSARYASGEWAPELALKPETDPEDDMEPDEAGIIQEQALNPVESPLETVVAEEPARQIPSAGLPTVTETVGASGTGAITDDPRDNLVYFPRRPEKDSGPGATPGATPANSAKPAKPAASLGLRSLAGSSGGASPVFSARSAESNAESNASIPRSAARGSASPSVDGEGAGNRDSATEDLPGLAEDLPRDLVDDPLLEDPPESQNQDIDSGRLAHEDAGEGWDEGDLPSGRTKGAPN